jgi:hypothetical protein
MTTTTCLANSSDIQMEVESSSTPYAQQFAQQFAMQFKDPLSSTMTTPDVSTFAHAFPQHMQPCFVYVAMPPGAPVPAHSQVLGVAPPLAQPLAQQFAPPLAQPLAPPLAQQFAPPLAQPLAPPLAQPLAPPLAMPLKASVENAPSVANNSGKAVSETNKLKASEETAPLVAKKTVPTPPVTKGVPYSNSMQADIEVGSSDNSTERDAEVTEAEPDVEKQTLMDRILSMAVKRCSKRKAPLEPLWCVDIKEALVALAHALNASWGQQMTCVNESDIRQFCETHLGVKLNTPIHRHYFLQRKSLGSRYLVLTSEAEEAVLTKRAAEHDSAIQAHARVMLFNDTEQAAEHIVYTERGWVFSLEGAGYKVSKCEQSMHRAIRARNRWFRMNQHSKIVQKHIVRVKTYPLLEGTRPISHISPL